MVGGPKRSGVVGTRPQASPLPEGGRGGVRAPMRWR